MKTTFKVFEAFSSSATYTVAKATNNIFRTKQIINNREIIFTAAIDDEGSADVQFYENTGSKDGSKEGFTFDLTGSGGELQVFSMIGNSLKELEQRYDPSTITFSSEKNPKRVNVYERMIKKFIPNYEITRTSGSTSYAYRLYKN